MDIDKQIITHKGHRIATALFSSQLNETSDDYRLGVVPPKYQHRPDLIAKVFFNKPSMFWKLLIVNRIPDPFEGLNSGDSIYLP